MEDYYTVSLDPETKQYCTLYLFTNVQNTAEIRKKVIRGELLCCVLKTKLIVDPFQVVVAANKAAINFELGRLTTKTLYTELLFNLSLSKNISRSLIEFGINDNDKHLLVAVIHKTNDDALSELLINTIKGERIPITRLPEFTEHDLVKKTYKIEGGELKVSDLADVIVSKMSCKDFASLK